MKILEALLKDYPDLEPQEEPEPQPTCQMCQWSEDVNEAGLCADCEKTFERGYQISQLAGRCANGAERDHGKLYHARMLDDLGARWQAVCGAKPGRRSAGWSSWKPADRQVTCKRCIKKLPAAKEKWVNEILIEAGYDPDEVGQRMEQAAQNAIARVKATQEAQR